MKRFYFILFLFPFIVFCQSDTEFKLQRSVIFEWGKNNCITNNDCFYINSVPVDVACYLLYYSYQGEEKQMIDTVFSFILYDLILNRYENEKDNSYVILLKIEEEHYPTFYVYHINNGKLKIIGKWVIYEPPGEVLPDYLDYSIEDIRIHQREDEIEFSFLKDMNFVDLSADIYNYDWVLYKAGELIISFNIVDETLRLIERDK